MSPAFYYVREADPSVVSNGCRLVYILLTKSIYINFNDGNLLSICLKLIARAAVVFITIIYKCCVVVKI